MHVSQYPRTWTTLIEAFPQKNHFSGNAKLRMQKRRVRKGRLIACVLQKEDRDSLHHNNNSETFKRKRLEKKIYIYKIHVCNINIWKLLIFLCCKLSLLYACIWNIKLINLKLIWKNKRDYQSIYCHCHGHYVLCRNMLLSQVCRSVTECAKVRQITTQCTKVTVAPRWQPK